MARAGLATVFPQAIGLAATWDETLAEQVADAVSTEARAKYNMQQRMDDTGRYKGLTLWAPNINIFRDPRWGRGHETYGEDPYLTSRMGIRFIEGLQGHDENYLKSAACVKHFAVHSGPEGLRHEFNAVVSKKICMILIFLHLKPVYRKPMLKLLWGLTTVPMVNLAVEAILFS